MISRFFILLCLLLFLANKNIQAQTFKAGIISGINFSKLTGDNLEGYNQYGLNIGGRIAIDPHPKLRLAADILFSQKGSRRSVDQFTSIQFENIRLNYMQIPLTVNIMDWMDDPNEEEYFRLHFSGGIMLGRLIHYNVIDKNGIDISNTLNFEKNAVDILGGLTYYVNEHIGISLQYSKSIRAILKSDINPPMLSKNVMLRLFYML